MSVKHSRLLVVSGRSCSVSAEFVNMSIVGPKLILVLLRWQKLFVKIFLSEFRHVEHTPRTSIVGPCIYDEDQAKRVKWAVDRGHQIASHTWSHAHLNNLTADQSALYFVPILSSF
jgi:hypothetical protein